MKRIDCINIRIKKSKKMLDFKFDKEDCLEIPGLSRL